MTTGKLLRVRCKPVEEVAYFVSNFVGFHLIYAYDLVSSIHCGSEERYQIRWLGVRTAKAARSHALHHETHHSDPAGELLVLALLFSPGSRPPGFPVPALSGDYGYTLCQAKGTAQSASTAAYHTAVITHLRPRCAGASGW
jgi:hypothetical protein